MTPFPLGAHAINTHQTRFTVWAPERDTVDVHLMRNDTYLPMEKDQNGYFSVVVDDVQVGDRYMYRLDHDRERPDPASRHQPDTVHGASAIVDTHFDWTDQDWSPPSLENSVFYEIHVGTYTDSGTYDAIIPHLPRLEALGITTIELMPVAQFPGKRNWGYDGVALFAPHKDYGGVQGLKRLVNACHTAGLAVCLDVVYNHLGPEGNYLWDYGPYFTERYHTPWGASLNFDGAKSDHVKRFFIENALYWLEDFHIDAFRLDATHELYDFSAVPFLEELTAEIHAWAEKNNKQVYAIAENDRSDRRLTLPRSVNGAGLDGQWLDDLHHTLHVALTSEDDGYYADYTDYALLLKVLREGFSYSGQYSPGWDRKHGTSSADLSTERFIVCTQNHDQVGNRMLGERLSALTDFDGLKLVAGLLLTSPYVPLLFMGQEYAETAPFLYFISHGDENLVKAVQEGRAEEFSAFAWKGSPPDPNAVETFNRSKLNHNLRKQGTHAIMYNLYRTLLTLRHNNPALTNPARDATNIYGNDANRILCMERRDANNTSAFRIVLNIALSDTLNMTLPAGDRWEKVIDSNASEWRPDGDPISTAPDTLSDSNQTLTLPPKSFAIYRRSR